MIPHIQIEEALARILRVGEDEARKVVVTAVPDDRDDESLKVAVTAVPDDRKGERLVVLHIKLDRAPDELRKGLAEAGLPNLYIPSADSFCEVPEIPVLGSGKLDLKGIRDIALRVFGEPNPG